MDEAGLILAAQRGDLDFFNGLVLHYQEMVFNLAYRMMGEVESSKDATQTAFISAYRNLGAYRGGSFKAWLLRIVSNACYDELRRRKRRPTQPLEPLDTDDQEIESPEWMANPGETPEQRAQRMELNQAIQHCLQDLPEEFRIVVLLVDVQGLDYAEAAQAVRKPVGTIKKPSGARPQRLRDCLQGSWELLPSAYRHLNEGDL